ncbi:hypothetical protein NHX12_032765 [Muraenolepis orangiensis]|uniref:Uncharacterized protein n=1 Tax=Muraenolepis orangiensis TaxID=630683 RepID=A0A9Q0E3V6_9TELE|nr:hypothetical protein NHX12_032765 [Muraenolepis orangiensis]
MSRLVLLLSALVALCGAAPALEPVTCSGEKFEANAARLAAQHINSNHHHGYKFRVSEVLSSQVDVEPQGCKITMEVNLQETKCVVAAPEHFEDYNELACPDCPTLRPLNDTTGLDCITKAVKQYNTDNATVHYFVLRDVGRISASYIMDVGMNYVTEFVMVETHCPLGSRIVIEACEPLCPDRARLTVCRTDKRRSILQCTTYPAMNQTSLAAGEMEPHCRRREHHTLSPTNTRASTATLARETRPIFPTDFCNMGVSDPAIHAICRWPRGFYRIKGDTMES